MSFVNIEGLIGAGKSTLCRLLNKEFGYPLFLEGVKDNEPLELFYTDMERYAFLLQMEFLFQRFVQHKSGLHLASLGEHSMVLTDRGLLFDKVFSDLMLEIGTMKRAEYETYLNMRNTLMSQTALPDAIFYIDTKPEVSLKRIKERGRDMEKEMTLDYLVGLEGAYKKELEALSKHIPVFFIPDDITLDSQAVNKFINHKLKTLTTKLFSITKIVGDR